MGMDKVFEIGTLVYKVIENDSGTPFLMEGVIVDVRVAEHPDPDDRYYPRYVETDVRWFAGAPDNIVESWGLDENIDTDWFSVTPEDAVQRYKNRLDTKASIADSRLVALHEARAAGRTVAFPKEKEDEF